MALIENEHLITILKDSGWLPKGKFIQRTFFADSYGGVINVVNTIADLAEEMNHHPNMEVFPDRVKVILSTHDEGGVSNLDVDLAMKINEELGE